jgi:aspartyl-tRNA(Asn)/glutamyl-tRNA(Gln) amidotransferase subunit A
VADAVLMYLVIANRAKDVPAIDEMLAPFGEQPLQGVRLGVPTTFFTDNIQPDVANAFRIAAQQMAELGATLIDVDWELAPVARAVAAVINRCESGTVHYDHIRSEQADLIESATRSRFEAGNLLSATAYLRACQAREVVRDSIASLYATHHLDAMIAPSTGATAPLAETLMVDYPDGPEGVGSALTRLTMPWNATGQPVVSVPCGFDRDELPIGLSIVGKPDDELGICRIAHHYEAATQWFQRYAAEQGA